MGYYDIFYLFENEAGGDDGSPDGEAPSPCGKVGALGGVGAGREGLPTPVCPRCLVPVPRSSVRRSGRPSCPGCGSPLHTRA